jgi:hypothetical protein
MKKTQIFSLLFSLPIAAFTFAQATRSVDAAANKSWHEFWAEFRRPQRHMRLLVSGSLIRPTTVQVRIARVISNADETNSPVPKTRIVILAKGERFSSLTNGRGIASFETVPCGEEIKIVVYDEDEGKNVELPYNLTCRLRPVALTIEESGGGPPELKRGLPRYRAWYLDGWHRRKF